VFMLPGFLLGVRFLSHYMAGRGQGMIQSLILGMSLIGVGFLLFVVGLLADLIASNRRLLERLDAKVSGQNGSPSGKLERL